MTTATAKKATTKKKTTAVDNYRDDPAYKAEMEVLETLQTRLHEHEGNINRLEAELKASATDGRDLVDVALDVAVAMDVSPAKQAEIASLKTAMEGVRKAIGIQQNRLEAVMREASSRINESAKPELSRHVQSLCEALTAADKAAQELRNFEMDLRRRSGSSGLVGYINFEPFKVKKNDGSTIVVNHFIDWAERNGHYNREGAK